MKISAYKTKFHGPAAEFLKSHLDSCSWGAAPSYSKQLVSVASGRQVGGGQGHDSFFLHSFHFMRCNIMQKHGHIIDTLTVC
jgi:hypothetical protein